MSISSSMLGILGFSSANGKLAKSPNAQITGAVYMSDCSDRNIDSRAQQATILLAIRSIKLEESGFTTQELL